MADPDPASLRERVAERAAEVLRDGEVVNLGVGIPTLIPEKVGGGKRITFHSENGVMSFRSLKPGDPHDQRLINASKQPIQELEDTAYFDSATSFAMIRGGHIGAAVLGAFQVDERGRVANWHVPGKPMLGVGGAMDLLVGARRVVIAMTHTGPGGEPKLRDACSLPVTATRPFDVVVTELATFERRDDQIVVSDMAPGVTPRQLKSRTPMDYDT